MSPPPEGRRGQRCAHAEARDRGWPRSRDESQAAGVSGDRARSRACIRKWTRTTVVQGRRRVLPHGGSSRRSTACAALSCGAHGAASVTSLRCCSRAPVSAGEQGA
eukprot:6178908-Pleurochrysis_carterae.AAC.1